MKEEKQNSRWKSVRSAFNTVHLWLGVGSGLILFAVCLSGTVYTFSTEIQKVTDSELYSVAVPPGAKRLSTETLMEDVLTAVGGGVVQAVTVPVAADASYQIIIGKGEGEKVAAGPPARARGTTYFVDPYTSEVLGTSETSSSAFFMWMFRLHRWLLLDMQIGRPIVGVATVIFVIIILTGWTIWFPKKIKNWRQGLKIKTSANWKRVNHDLHASLGFYASIFLFVMAITGLTWSFESYKKGFLNALGAEARKPDQLTSVVSASPKPSFETYLAAADEVLPYPGDYRVNLPSDTAGVVTIMKTKTSFFATSVADRLMLDQYSAAVLKSEVFSEKPLNEKIASSIKAIHVGSFYGTFSKIIYFIACLIGTSLPVTGVIIWLNKLKKKKKKKSLIDESLVASR